MRLPTLPPTVVGALCALLGFGVFSVHDVIVKQLGATYSTFQIVFFSALLSFPLLSIALMSDHRPGTLRPVHPWWLALRSLSGAASGLSAFYAISTLPLAQVYAFIFASPLLITLLAIPILGETVRLRRGLAVVIGLLGVVVVLNPSATPLTSGHIAALGAAFAGALSSIIVRKIGKEERRVVMVIYPMMTNLIVTAMILPFVYVEVPIGDLGLFAIDAVLVLIAMSLIVAAYARAKAIVIAPMQYSQIIWATLFGILLFEEYPDAHTYVGAAIIALSGVYILMREASAGASQNTPVLETRTRIGQTAGWRVGDRLRRRRKP